MSQEKLPIKPIKPSHPEFFEHPYIGPRGLPGQEERPRLDIWTLLLLLEVVAAVFAFILVKVLGSGETNSFFAMWGEFSLFCLAYLFARD